MSERRKKVVLVGHCTPDAYALKSAVDRAAPGADVAFVNDEREAIRAAADADLLMVNRVFEGEFEAESGISLIAKMAGVRARLMLVSNYPDAQAQAIAAGAVPGVGKLTMNGQEAQQRIREALAG